MIESYPNPNLLGQIFKREYRWLVDRLRHNFSFHHYAEDIASESFLKLATMQGLAEVREPRAILTTISNRILYEMSRRKSLERAYLNALAAEPESLQPSPEEQHLFMESLMALDRVLEQLSARARQAFFYSQLDGLTYAEIGEKLGVSASMVRQYMAKAFMLCYQVATKP